MVPSPSVSDIAIRNMTLTKVSDVLVLIRDKYFCSQTESQRCGRISGPSRRAPDSFFVQSRDFQEDASVNMTIHPSS